MGLADSLSRRPDLKGEIESDNIDQIVLPEHRFADLRALSGIVLHLQGDEFIKRIQKSTNEYDRKTKKALEEAVRSRVDKAQDMAIWKREGGLIMRNGLIVVPRDRILRRDIVAACHDTPTAGHPGRLKTREFVQRDFWWPNMIRDVDSYVNRCPI